MENENTKDLHSQLGKCIFSTIIKQASLQGLISTVNLMKYRITSEISLQAYLWGIVQSLSMQISDSPGEMMWEDPS